MMLPLAPDENDTEASKSPVSEAPRAERWGNHHPVNIRLSVPFFTRRYYLTIIGGEEQRSTERLAEEREKHPLTTTANMIFLFTVGFILGGSCWIGLQAVATWLWRVAVT
jgi:hypothetical protein